MPYGRLALVSLLTESVLDGGESVGLTLAFRPSSNLIQIDNMSRSHQDGLLKALEVISVVVPGKPILDAIRGRNQPDNAS